jgi:hypothetical protein
LIKLSEEEKDFSRTNSESDDEIVLLRNIAWVRGNVRTAKGGARDLQSESLSKSDQSYSESHFCRQCRLV